MSGKEDEAANRDCGTLVSLGTHRGAHMTKGGYSVDSHDEPMRVLHVIHGFNTGGAETLVRDYLLFMQGEYIESRAICFGRLGSPYEAQLKEAGIRVTYLADGLPKWVKFLGPIGRPVRMLYNYRGMRREVRGWQPDVVHSHLTLNRYVSFALGRCSRSGYAGKPVRVVHTVHNEPEKLWFITDEGFRTWVEGRLDFLATTRLIRSHHMRLVALHEQMRLELNELFGVDNTVVVNNGIDFSRFDYIRSRDDVRYELGIPQGAFVVGHVGRFSSQKNHEKVISVFAKVYERRKDAFLLLIGAGPTRSRIEHELKERGLNDCSCILENRSDIPDLMGCMDSFVFPSKFEGLGIVLIEAQKSSLPCVVSSTIPSQATISNLVRVHSLDEEDSKWAADILAPAPDEIEYYGLEEWDMRNVVCRLESLYRGTDEE